MAWVYLRLKYYFYKRTNVGHIQLLHFYSDNCCFPGRNEKCTSVHWIFSWGKYPPSGRRYQPGSSHESFSHSNGCLYTSSSPFPSSPNLVWEGRGAATATSEVSSPNCGQTTLWGQGGGVLCQLLTFSHCCSHLPVGQSGVHIAKL